MKEPLGRAQQATDLQSSSTAHRKRAPPGGHHPPAGAGRPELQPSVGGVPTHHSADSKAPLPSRQGGRQSSIPHPQKWARSRNSPFTPTFRWQTLKSHWRTLQKLLPQPWELPPTHMPPLSLCQPDLQRGIKVRQQAEGGGTSPAYPGLTEEVLLDVEQLQHCGTTETASTAKVHPGSSYLVPLILSPGHTLQLYPHVPVRGNQFHPYCKNCV